MKKIMNILFRCMLVFFKANFLSEQAKMMALFNAHLPHEGNNR